MVRQAADDKYSYFFLDGIIVNIIPVIIVGSQRMKDHIPAWLTNGFSAGPL
jgi:hypothetical protein